MPMLLQMHQRSTEPNESAEETGVPGGRETALETSEARVRAMLDSALDAIVTIDHQGRITEFNAAAERIFGHVRGDVLGRQMVELLVPPRLRAAHVRGLQHYLATGEGPVLGRRIEVPAVRADGSEFSIELSIVRAEMPGPPVFTAYARDVSDRLRRDAALQESSAIIASSFDAIISRTPEGIVTSWNAAAERIFGYEAAEIIGRSITSSSPLTARASSPGSTRSCSVPAAWRRSRRCACGRTACGSTSRRRFRGSSTLRAI